MAKGQHEIQLETVVAADEWQIAHLSDLVGAVDEIARTLAAIAESPGWKGVSADRATAAFAARSKELVLAAQQMDAVSSNIASANIARRAAREEYDALPDATVPSWVHQAVALAGSAPLVLPLIGGPLAFLNGVAGHEAVNLVQNYLDGQRDAAAHEILNTLGSNLTPPTAPDQFAIGITPDPQSGGSSASGSGHSGSHGYGGGSISTRSAGQSGGNGSYASDPGISGLEPDGPTNSGTLPGGFPVPGGSDNGGSVSGEFGGSGVLGGLAAGGAGMAALSAAGRFGGGGGLIGAGTSNLGSGGLLGASGKGGAGAAASAAEGEGVGAGAGAKPGTSMMGGSGASGSNSKEKRSGLGGFIAPKLEDDEEFVPRSTGAFAGSRDDASSTDD